MFRKCDTKFHICIECAKREYKKLPKYPLKLAKDICYTCNKRKAGTLKICFVDLSYTK